MPPIILWVEDNKEDVLALEEAFEEAGVPVTFVIVESAVEAFWYIDKRFTFKDYPRPPDLILIDLHLPALRGPVILKELQSSKEYSRIPKIVFASLLNPVELNECRDFGACECITKPNTFEGFLAVVDILKRYLPTSGSHPTDTPSSPGGGDTSRIFRQVS